MVILSWKPGEWWLKQKHLAQNFTDRNGRLCADRAHYTYLTYLYV